MSEFRVNGLVTATSTEPIDVSAWGNSAYVGGRQTVTVHSGLGSIELPWDAHPMLKVGQPVTFIVEVNDE